MTAPPRPFDESRLVKPGEWEDFDDEEMLANMEAKMTKEMDELRRTIKVEAQSDSKPATASTTGPAQEVRPS